MASRMAPQFKGAWQFLGKAQGPPWAVGETLSVITSLCLSAKLQGAHALAYNGLQRLLA
jgi:hypothetical protein